MACSSPPPPAVAGQVDSGTGSPGARLLPPIDTLRDTSVAVAVAVAQAAARDGVAREEVDHTIEQRVRNRMWRPEYAPVHAV